MKGRDSKGLGGPPSTDLLVCFPSRAHFSLMPKPICSPARPSEPNKRHHHHHHHHHVLKRINTRGSGGPASPLLWAKNKQMGGGGSTGPEIAEPTSPKVTCAGQIKVRPRPSAACKNWESVMEEIERIHNRSKLHKKKSNWAGPLGFKKDVMNFLTCLRSIRLDFRCFGSFPEPDVNTSDDEDEDEEEEDDVVDDHEEAGDQGTDQGSTVFSKWFMVLQENQHKEKKFDGGELGNDDNAPAVPPPNALLLMRCRSAPAKSWLEEKENRAKKETQEDEETKVGERKKKRESLAIVMKYDADFYNLSTDVAQETWLVGGFKDPFSRSRSWKR